MSALPVGFVRMHAGRAWLVVALSRAIVTTPSGAARAVEVEVLREEPSA